MLYHGGDILTMNSSQPEYVDCIVTEGETIVYSGEDVIIVIITILIMMMIIITLSRIVTIHCSPKMCFLQTGSREGADAILRPGFEIEDLAGRCLMPGFIGDYYFNYHYHHYWLDNASCLVSLVIQEYIIVNISKRVLFKQTKSEQSSFHDSPSQTHTSIRPWRL